MSFEQTNDPTVMATPPVPPVEPPAFTPPPAGEAPKKKKTWLIILIIVLVLLCCCCLFIGGLGYFIYSGAGDINFDFDLDDFSYLTPFLSSLV